MEHFWRTLDRVFYLLFVVILHYLKFKIMGTNFYVRFADSKRSEKVSIDEYRRILRTLTMTGDFHAFEKITFHSLGRTLFVSFPKSYFSYV